MKRVTIAALVIGLLSSNAFAQGTANNAPNLTLALNTANPISWFIPNDVKRARALVNEVEIATNRAMVQVSIDLDKQLENKIAKELEYAM